MTSSSSDLDVLKNNIVTETFVNTADQNYLIARWAYHRGMFNDFFWNSVHSLEKYLKASLLLNGRSGKIDDNGKPYGHDLVKLLEAVSSYAGDLIPGDLRQPEELAGLSWRKESLADYVARLNELGDPNNRYNIYGYVQRWEDLSHLDQVVFSIRRLAFRLDAYPFIGRPNVHGSHPKTVREMLEQNPKYSPRSAASRLHKLLGVKGDDELRDAGLKMNFVFAPDGYDHGLGKIRICTSGSNSVLYRRIVAVSESDSPTSQDADAADLADWLIENVFLPKSVKAELASHAETLRNRVRRTS